MANPFDVSDTPRPVLPGVSPDVPLVTLAWRALHAHHQRLAVDADRHGDALAEVAMCVFRLGRVLAGAPGNPADSSDGLAALASAVATSLRSVGVEIVAPAAGTPYSSEHMELIDNVSQVRAAGTSVPSVEEVIEPAILYHGALVRTGKAVIRVPEYRENEPVTESGCNDTRSE